MMLITLMLVGLVNGLTEEEIAAFKPINPDRIEQNTGVRSLVNITDPGPEYDYLIAYTNGVPSHDDFKWPREDELRVIYLKEIEFTLTIPKEPKLREEPLMCTPFDAFGIATGGVFIYNAYAPRVGCPMAYGAEAFDNCNGHPTPPGAYHYHAYSPCNSMEVCGQPSKIYGVALDGIPIYGPFDEDGRQLVKEDLDICGGKFDSHGNYRYHVTADPPYFMNCLMGELHKDFVASVAHQPEYLSCTCPFDDQYYPECFEDEWCEDNDGLDHSADEAAWEARVANREQRPSICDADDNDGTFAKCEDIFDTSYTPGYKYERAQATMDLIPCCPVGEDCGKSCYETDKCYTESRTAQYLQYIP